MKKKKKLKEQREKDQKKITRIRKSIIFKDRELESKKSQEQLELINDDWEDTESYEIEELDKQIEKEQEKN